MSSISFHGNYIVFKVRGRSWLCQIKSVYSTVRVREKLWSWLIQTVTGGELRSI